MGALLERIAKRGVDNVQDHANKLYNKWNETPIFSADGIDGGRRNTCWENTHSINTRKNRKPTIDLLRKSEHTAWRSIQDLVFRFDVLLDGNEIYLNGIDVFPVALSFLDEYITCEDFLEKMVECTCKYMQDHSTNAEARPM
jgi:hypothetical protein